MSEPMTVEVAEHIPDPLLGCIDVDRLLKAHVVPSAMTDWGSLDVRASLAAARALQHGSGAPN